MLATRGTYWATSEQSVFHVDLFQALIMGKERDFHTDCERDDYMTGSEQLKNVL